MNTLRDMINGLWDGSIQAFNIDTLKHEIKFKVEVIENGVSFPHEVLFEGVTTYLYIDNIGDKRFAISDNDYLELTSINYLEKGIGNIVIDSEEENWVRQWHASANFSIELWSGLLLIEANKVHIDGVTFQVGYPEKTMEQNQGKGNNR